jgi:hypothetical protein
MLTSELAFADLYVHLRRRWPWLVIAIVAGGIVGAILGQLLPTRMRATASLGVGVDYGRSQPLSAELERLALLHVQELILEDATLARALALAGAGTDDETIPSPADLRSSIRLDRYENRWDLIVHARSSARAEALAEAWSSAALEGLEEAMVHALRAQELQARLYGLGCRLERIGDQGEVRWQCLAADGEVAQADLPQALVEEIQRSRGILPALTFGRLRSGAGSAETTRQATPLLALAGAVAGGSWMLIALLWLGSPPEQANEGASAGESDKAL